MEPPRPIKRSEKAGLPPGSLVYVGRAKAVSGPPRITVIEYGPDHFAEQTLQAVTDLHPLKPTPMVTWINVDGVANPQILKAFGETFSLHPLLLEDILNTDQRPKCEFTETNIYAILKMFEFDTVKQQILTEQVSLVVGENYLITFLEEVGDEFDAIRERLHINHSKFRTSGPDYLAYSLIDTVVDRYFIVLETMGEALDILEAQIESGYDPKLLKRIHRIKREMIFLRKYIWPVREVVTTLQHADTPLLPDVIRPYLRDVYEHTIQVMDTLDTYRDLLAGIQDLYLSIASNRLNEIMKILTIISTIFIPLTFITGVYGMNFLYMPELSWRWGYFTVWLVMLLIAGGMILFVRRKQWL
ncbi:MAG TPA: magnesium/cobalt transporter CorA [Oculatellaceae cyanobacterium]|jgi:magnesium transporter